MKSQQVSKFVTSLVCVGMWVVMGSAPATSAETLTLRQFVWEGQGYEAYQAKFSALVKTKHGVELKFENTYVKGYEDFLPVLRDERADVVSIDHFLMRDERFPFIALKLLLPLNVAANIPNFTLLPPALQTSAYWTEGGGVYGVPTFRGIMGIAYNLAIVKDPPTSWQILWEPQFEGKYTLGNFYEYDNYITALAMGIPPDKMSDYKTLNTQAFQEKLAQLALNANALWEGIDQPADYQGMSLVVGWGVALPALKAKGEQWKMAELKEGMPGYVTAFTLSRTLEKNPQLKQIAEEWLNYLLSDELQASDIREMGCWPVTTTVKNVLTPEEIAAFHLDDPTYLDQHVTLAPTLSKLDRKGLERLWNDALAKRK